MSKMVRAGNLLFLAGQTSSGAPHARTIEEQATEALERIVVGNDLPEGCGAV
jgi:enamine deaminase RidA (YjgF/YER057c/UK114 family)